VSSAQHPGGKDVGSREKGQLKCKPGKVKGTKKRNRGGVEEDKKASKKMRRGGPKPGRTGKKVSADDRKGRKWILGKKNGETIHRKAGTPVSTLWGHTSTKSSK